MECVCSVFVVRKQEMYLTDGEVSGNEDPDVTDECAMLLRTDALLHKQNKASVGGATGTNITLLLTIFLFSLTTFAWFFYLSKILHHNAISIIREELIF